jgi:hypothetical protein
MSTDELRRKYELACNYGELRAEQLEFIVKASKGCMDDKYFRGMVMLIAETDSWKTNYEGLLKQRKEENNG